MKSLYAKIAAFTLLAGLLSACGGQASSSPTSEPTKAASSVQAAPAVTDAAVATQAPVATQPAGQSSQAATVSFTNDILPILQSRCVNCHGGNRTEKGLNITTYKDLMSGSENGPVVTPGNAADSLLVQMIVDQKMPKRGPKLTPAQLQLITDWVNQGAQNN